MAEHHYGTGTIRQARNHAEMILQQLDTYRPAWHAEAACRGKGPEAWYPEPNQEPAGAAVAACERCTVRTECRAAAEAQGETCGVWAGEVRTARATWRKAG